MDMVTLFVRAQSSKADIGEIYYQTKITFSEISTQKAGNELTYHILHHAIHF